MERWRGGGEGNGLKRWRRDVQKENVFLRFYCEFWKKRTIIGFSGYYNRGQIVIIFKKYKEVRIFLYIFCTTFMCSLNKQKIIFVNMQSPPMKKNWQFKMGGNHLKMICKKDFANKFGPSLAGN